MKKTVGLLLLAMLFALPTTTALSLVGVLTAIFAIGYFFCLAWRMSNLGKMFHGFNDYW